MISKKCPKCTEEKLLELFPKDRTRSDGYGSYCKSCKNEYKASYRKSDKGKSKIKSYNKVYRKERMKDPKIRFRENLRGRVRNAFKRKSWKKTGSVKYFGCDFNTAIKWIESFFEDGMSWDNYGKWHLDHFIPLDYATTIEHMEKLNYYKNLQPLWGPDNIEKGNILPNISEIKKRGLIHLI